MYGLTLKIFCIAFIVFIITDMVWLGFIAKPLYFKYYSPWLNIVDDKLQLVWWAGAIVYLLFALSVVVFIIPLSGNSPYLAAYYAAILGAIIYGVYNFTCLAIFKNFPVFMGFVDSFWGSFLYAWSSFITVYLSNHLLK